MHRALLKLVRLQVRGWVRRQFKGGSARRMILGIFGTVMFLLWLSALSVGAAFAKTRTPEEIMATLPLFLTGFALLPIVFGNEDRAIAFSPAEVGFLFPGPFTRRELVLFKMLKLVLGSIFGGLFFALVLRRFAGSFVAGAVGAVLALTFINLAITVVALARDLVAERFYTLARRAAMVVLVGGIAGVVWYANQSDAPTVQDFRRLGESGAVRVALAPARVFAHVFAAQSLAEGAAWATACLGLILAAAAGVLALDKGYMEAALAASERRQTRMARAGRGLSMPVGKPVKAVRLPRLAGLGPAGAIVRKQLITALRTSRAWMVVFVLAGVYGYVVSRLIGRAGGGAGGAGIAGVIPGVIVLLTMLPQMLRFDFRGDLDQMDLLKSLPATPWSVAWAELAVPTLILSLQGWVILGAAAGMADLSAARLGMAALAVPPMAVLVIGLENVVFLLVPTRLLTPGQGGMAFSGRRLLMMLGRMVLLGVGGGATALTGWGAWAATGSMGAAFTAGWLMLCVVGLGVVSATAWAFARFDVSADMPV